MDTRQASPHPIKLYRPGALAKLWGCNISTIWRYYKKEGVLPWPTQIGGIKGWTESQLATVIKNGQRGLKLTAGNPPRRKRERVMLKDKPRKRERVFLTPEAQARSRRSLEE